MIWCSRRSMRPSRLVARLLLPERVGVRRRRSRSSGPEVARHVRGTRPQSDEVVGVCRPPRNASTRRVPHDVAGRPARALRGVAHRSGASRRPAPPPRAACPPRRAACAGRRTQPPRAVMPPRLATTGDPDSVNVPHSALGAPRAPDARAAPGPGASEVRLAHGGTFTAGGWDRGFGGVGEDRGDDHAGVGGALAGGAGRGRARRRRRVRSGTAPGSKLRSAVRRPPLESRAACAPAIACCCRARPSVCRRSRRTPDPAAGRRGRAPRTRATPGGSSNIVGDVRPVLAVIDGDDDRMPPLPLEPLSPVRTRDTPIGVSAADGIRDRLDLADDDALGMVAYTKRRRAGPRARCLSRDNLRAGADALVEAWRWTPDDRLVHALPMFHMHGLGAAINGGSLAAGVDGRAPALRHRRGRRGRARARRHDVLRRTDDVRAAARPGRLPETRPPAPARQRLGPLDPRAVRGGTPRAGQAPVERYGMSETVMLASNLCGARRKAGAVGLPTRRRNPVSARGGAVEVVGPNVFRGYWERPEANAAAFTDDSWFRTGDIGEARRRRLPAPRRPRQ